MKPILVILPTFNEAENISLIIRWILNISDRYGIPLNILVIDDNSPDGTARIVYREYRLDKRVGLIIRYGVRGYASAVYRGLKYGYYKGYKHIIVMDADLQHNPIYIPRMLEAARYGCSLVVASRYVDGGGIVGWSILRRMISIGANILARLILRIDIRDSTSGYRLYDWRALSILVKHGFRSSGFAIQPESIYLLKRRGLKICEVPFIFVNRRRGRSKLNIGTLIDYTLNLFRLRVFE